MCVTGIHANFADVGEEQRDGSRGFGSALQAVLRYLGTSVGDTQQGSRAERQLSNGSAGVSGRQEEPQMSLLGRAGAYWTSLAWSFAVQSSRAEP